MLVSLCSRIQAGFAVDFALCRGAKSEGENRSELAPGVAASPGCAKVCLGKDALPPSELLVGAVPLQNSHPSH